MFRKLRFQLMLVNLSVILLLFLLLITGTYFFVQNRMMEGSEHMMDRLSKDLVAGKFIALPPGPPNHDLNREPHDNPMPGPIIFFVKVDSAGKIIQTSPYLPLTTEEITTLTLETQKVGNLKGRLPFAKTEYLYCLSPLPNGQGAFIIFQDFEKDHNLLMALITGLSITGLVCMLLSLLGSFYMANKAMIPIQKAWQQQKDFLADASHEFRTPLAVIQMNLEIVRDNPRESVESQDRWLSNIYEVSLCMAKLVESLLFLARADSHQQLLVMNPIHLDQIILTTVELFRPIALTKGVTLSLEIKAETSYFGDESKLRQVIGILIDNALRHTPMNGIVTVLLEKSSQCIILSVTDTGEGIDPNHVNNIFERFYQSDSSRSKGGAGLGLSIAKWIIESHKGTIQAFSTLGKGSIFKISLPY